MIRVDCAFAHSSSVEAFGINHLLVRKVEFEMIYQNFLFFSTKLGRSRGTLVQVKKSLVKEPPGIYSTSNYSEKTVQ